MDELHRAVLARFTEDEPQMLWAADASSDFAVVRFPDGVDTVAERTEFRTLCRDRLVCIVGQCRAPLTAHFRFRKKPGFAHAAGTAGMAGSHPERLWHRMAKEVIAQWAAAQGAVATIEEASSDRSRRPDVTVRTAGGAVIGFEVQYSSISADQYRERSDDHRRQYTAMVWLLGQGGDNFKRTQHGIVINTLAELVHEDGHVLVWFNTSEETVLTAWHGKDGFGPMPATGAVAANFGVSALADCLLDDTYGLLTSHQHQLNVAARAREEAKRASEEAARAEEERRAAVEAAKRAEHERRLRAWESSGERSWLLGKHAVAPAALSRSYPRDPIINELTGRDGVHWRTSLYRRIDESPEWHSWRWVCRQFRLLHRDKAIFGRLPVDQQNACWDSLGSFMVALASEGLVQINATGGRPEVAALGVPTIAATPTRPGQLSNAAGSGSRAAPATPWLASPPGAAGPALPGPAAPTMASVPVVAQRASLQPSTGAATAVPGTGQLWPPPCAPDPVGGDHVVVGGPVGQRMWNAEQPPQLDSFPPAPHPAPRRRGLWRAIIDVVGGWR